MNNICFHSILSSNQEVEFFTNILLDTGIAGELDHNVLAELETIPQEALLDEEAEALAEQWDIETAQDPEWLEFLESDTSLKIDHKWIADQVVRGIDL
jgi:hypothetical protein